MAVDRVKNTQEKLSLLLLLSVSWKSIAGTDDGEGRRLADGERERGGQSSSVQRLIYMAN